MIDHNIYRSSYWSNSREYDPFTYNYYLNITIFPWLEIAYTCTLVKGGHNSSYWPPQTWGKFVNQDRSFHGRLRLWKEGWWKSWTPQIVLGANDPGSHENAGGGNLTFQDAGESTNHLTRFYLAATKHFIFQRWGTLGGYMLPSSSSTAWTSTMTMVSPSVPTSVSTGRVTAFGQRP